MASIASWSRVLTEVFNIIYRCVNCVSICFISSKSAQKRWSSAEKDEVRRLFAVHIATQRLPTKKKIETIAQSSTVLKDRLGVLFDNICDFITSADMLLWNLEYSLLQFSSCGSLRHNGIGWTSANAGDVLRRRPCRELPCFL